jgi:hypothetical protein
MLNEITCLLIKETQRKFRNIEGREGCVKKTKVGYVATGQGIQIST